MELTENYESLSRRLADIMLETVLEKNDASIIIATGDSPRLGYRLFSEEIQKKNIDISRVKFIKLDEWVGLPEENPATCEYFIRKELIKPLGILESNYLAFDGNAQDLEAECDRIGRELENIGNVDLVILGVGKNGHLGLNEPSDEFLLSPHKAKLDAKTKTHSMLAEAESLVQWGVTLGIGAFFAAKRAVLLVTGLEKEEAVKALLSDVVLPQVPATVMKLHKNLTCIAERKLVEAAKNI